jgi:cytochrome c biogenesis protein CcdA
MPNQIVALAQEFAQQRVQTAVRRAVLPAAFGLAAAVLFLFAVAGLFVALFYWLAPLYGPAGAALITAAVAFVLGLLAIAPLAFKRRPKPPPPPAADSTLPHFVSLMAQTSTNSPRQAAVAAFLLAVALGLMARGSSSSKK